MKRNLLKSVRLFSILMLFLPLILIQSCETVDQLTGAAATISKIEGNWTCDEQSEIYKATLETYTVTISADPDKASGVIIDNFYGLNSAAKATITGMSVIISNQTMDGGFSVSGSGTISSDFETIHLSYEVDDGSGQVDHVTAVYTKQ
jgi:hypothetical protein